MPIEKNDIVKMIYTGKLEDGTIFDEITEDKPIEFQVGKGEVVTFLDNLVIGMERGEEKNIEITPENAYGAKDPGLIKKLDRNIFPENIKIDTILLLKNKDGIEVPGRIVKITKNNVIIDLNHPLAGKTLNFQIKIIDIIKKN